MRPHLSAIARLRLNNFGRQLLLERVLAGWTPATAPEAQPAGIFRATAYKWLRRRLAGPSRPFLPPLSADNPHRLDAVAEADILTCAVSANPQLGWW